MDELLGRGSQPSVEERWRAYVEDEGRRRLGWGTFVCQVDVFMRSLSSSMLKWLHYWATRV